MGVDSFIEDNISLTRNALIILLFLAFVFTLAIISGILEIIFPKWALQNYSDFSFKRAILATEFLKNINFEKYKKLLNQIPENDIGSKGNNNHQS